MQNSNNTNGGVSNTDNNTKRITKRIAIVDDAVDVHPIFKRALEMNGHKVVFTAFSGEEIVEAVSKGTAPDFDLVIMDYRLPGMNGLEASREILKHRSNVIIVMATGDDGITEDVHSSDLPIACTLVKPFSMSKLANSVDNASLSSGSF